MKAVTGSKKAVNTTEQKRSKLYTFKRSERQQHHVEDDRVFWEFENSGYYSNNNRILRPKLVYLLLVSLLCFIFVFTPHLFSSSAFSLLCKILSSYLGFACSTLQILSFLCF